MFYEKDTPMVGAASVSSTRGAPEVRLLSLYNVHNFITR
jgi:hypothetical protein